MLGEEDMVTSCLVNGTFADDVRDIGAIQKRWVSLKDLMFFVDELTNLVDLMEDYKTYESSFIDA